MRSSTAQIGCTPAAQSVEKGSATEGRGPSHLGKPNPAKTDALDGWLTSLAGLVPVPAPHSQPLLDAQSALGILRCGESTLEQLLAHGLPHEQRDGTVWLDRFDVFNLGLHSRSGRSLPELTIGFVTRLAREGEDALTERRGWRARIQLRCPRGEACAPDCRWTFGLPRPESLGGRLTGLTVPAGSRASAGAVVSHGPAQAFGFEATLVSEGRGAKIQSPALREAYRSVMGEFRFQIMPRALKVNVAQISRLGVADCDGVSFVLAEACAQAGHDAWVEYGFMLGPFGFGHHTWVRVRDLDGQLKTLEPTLPIVSMLGEHDSSQFADFCCGSTLNRIVACTVPDVYLAEHTCTSSHVEPDVVIRVRPDAAQLAHGALS